MRLAELCAGYGGLGMALRAAGWPVELTWYAENDPDASTVMAAHHPGVPNIGDITTAQWTAQEPVDVLAAGFPCQPVSGAGRQQGSGDERWLWSDVARAVRIVRPPMVVLENVARLLTIEEGSLFGGILADLDDLGYFARWAVVGACRVGLAHHRHRVFIVAMLNQPAAPQRWPLARRTAAVAAGPPHRWEVAADTLLPLPGIAPAWPPAGVVSGGVVWAEPAAVCGVVDGVLLPTPNAALGRGTGTPSPELARRRLAGGNRFLDDAIASLLPTPTASDTTGAGHPTTAEGSPNLRTIAATLLPTPRARDGKGRDPNPRGVDLNEAVALLPTPRATDGTKGGPNQCNSDGSLALSAVVQPGRWGSHDAAIDRWAAILGRPAPDPTDPDTRGQPRLSPRFVEWLMGLPAGWVTDHVGRNAALRILGNGVVPQQGAHALAHLTDSRPGLTRVSPHTCPRPAGPTTPPATQETP